MLAARPLGAPSPAHRTSHRRSRAGCLTTAGVLSVGFGAFINGNKVLAQNMMRARVLFQGLTVAAMGVATGWAATSESEASTPAKPAK